MHFVKLDKQGDLARRRREEDKTSYFVQAQCSVGRNSHRVEGVGSVVSVREGYAVSFLANANGPGTTLFAKFPE